MGEEWGAVRSDAHWCLLSRDRPGLPQPLHCTRTRSPAPPRAVCSAPRPPCLAWYAGVPGRRRRAVQRHRAVTSGQCRRCDDGCCREDPCAGLQVGCCCCCCRRRRRCCCCSLLLHSAWVSNPEGCALAQCTLLWCGVPHEQRGCRPGWGAIAICLGAAAPPCWSSCWCRAAACKDPCSLPAAARGPMPLGAATGAAAHARWGAGALVGCPSLCGAASAFF
jgi:hypothetical protein